MPPADWLIELEPDYRTLVAAAHRRRSEGNRAGAASLFEHAAHLEPANVDVRLEQARDLQALNRLDAAHDVLVAAAAIDPADARALVEIARDHWARGKADLAGRALRQARERNPGFAPAWLVAAEHALAAEDAHAAFEFASRARRLDPSTLGPWLAAARAAEMGGDFDAARTLLERSWDSFGRDPAIAVARSEMHRRLGEFAAARTVIVEARAAGAPGGDADQGLWREDAAIALATGDFVALEVALAAAPATSPGDRAAALAFRARAAAARHDHQSAVAGYQVALALLPSAADWRYELARSQLLLTDIAAARKSLIAWVGLRASAAAARGQTVHVSQSQVGQLLDDFSLDQDVLAALRAVASTGQLRALARIVAREPDATAPAIVFLRVAMAAGRMAVRAGSVTGVEAIPRRIGQYWDREPPAKVVSLMTSWPHLNPHHAYRRFDSRSAERFIAENHGADALAAFRRCEDAAHRTDLIRLAWLASEGGVFADGDALALTPLTAFVPTGVRLVGYRDSLGALATDVLAASPDHPVIRRALDLAVRAINRGDRDMAWLKTGPGLLTRAFAQLAARDASLLAPGATAVLEQWEFIRAVTLRHPVGATPPRRMAKRARRA